VTTNAVQHIKRMHGGAQSHLMRCDDGNYYVVKFRNNPQHDRVLANEFFATRLAALVGLPVPEVRIVDVSESIVSRTPELTIVRESEHVPCEAGLQFGSRLAVSPIIGQLFDYLPRNMLQLVKNTETFGGMLAFDKWVCNVDTRQAAFWRIGRDKKFSVTFIDQGHCFNAGEWQFSDGPLRGVYPQHEVYADVTSWASFEPWLSKIEMLTQEKILMTAAQIPPEWYGSAGDKLQLLVRTLIQRRQIIRDLIYSFRACSRRPFPAWQDAA
jgi:hypothetical protein